MAQYVASVQATYGGQSIANVFGMATDAAGGAETSAQAAVIAEKVATAWVAHFATNQVVQLAYSKTVVRGAGNASVVAEQAMTATGQATGATGLPGFVVIKAKVVTTTLGRTGTGRMGFSGINEVATPEGAPNQIGATTVAAWQAAANAFLAAVNTGDTGMVVISRKGTTPLLKVVTSAPVTSISILSGLGSRLSRLR